MPDTPPLGRVNGLQLLFLALLAAPILTVATIHIITARAARKGRQRREVDPWQ